MESWEGLEVEGKGDMGIGGNGPEKVQSSGCCVILFHLQILLCQCVRVHHNDVDEEELGDDGGGVYCTEKNYCNPDGIIII